MTQANMTWKQIIKANMVRKKGNQGNMIWKEISKVNMVWQEITMVHGQHETMVHDPHGQWRDNTGHHGLEGYEPDQHDLDWNAAMEAWTEMN